MRSEAGELKAETQRNSEFSDSRVLAELTLGIDRFLAGLPPIHSPLARFLEAFLTKNVEFPQLPKSEKLLRLKRNLNGIWLLQAMPRNS